MNLDKLALARKIVANVMDFDMHNLILPRNPVNNLEDAAEGAYEFLPRKIFVKGVMAESPFSVLRIRVKSS